MEFPTIQQGQPEFDAWREYFERHLRMVPFVMRMAIEDPERSFTVPTRWPEWFDSSFVQHGSAAKREDAA